MRTEIEPLEDGKGWMLVMEDGEREATIIFPDDDVPFFVMDEGGIRAAGVVEKGAAVETVSKWVQGQGTAENIEGLIYGGTKR